ncbi:MAG TPA: SdpI family protein [Candidatus Paceibacterota bacterium]|jgi:uncharacterized membrane protein|nr:SdpI family protein [Candidatus Paceibacterota bacterium]
MQSRVAQRIAWAILALTVLGTLAAFPSLPDVMATHFNASGQVNGTTVSYIGAFIIPFVMLCVLLLFTAIPRIDPLRVNIAQFRRQYDTFVALLMLFFAIVQTLIISRNLGFLIDPNLVILPAVGILMFYVGMILPQTKRNWFIGIRTPWTISSDHVWQKTHELGGTLFKVLGVIIVLGTFAPSFALWIIIVPLVIIVVGLVLYSYVLYAQDSRA